MKRFFFIISFFIIFSLFCLAYFSYYQFSLTKKLFTTQQNLNLLKDKTTNFTLFIDKNIDDILDTYRSGEKTLTKNSLLNIYNEINNFKTLLRFDIITAECIYCHKKQDPKITKMRSIMQNLTDNALIMQNNITLYISGQIKFDKIAENRKQIQAKEQELTETLQNMQDHINDLIFYKNSQFHKIGLIITSALLIIIFIFILIFNKKFIRDIDSLMKLSQIFFEEQKIPNINLKQFNNKEIREFVESFIISMKKLYEKEQQLQEQMEEIASMNDELQASNQQMEMLTFELEEARENLEAIVKEKTRELQRAYKELQELDTLKSNFLHSISHEFKTPLTPLFGYLKLFKNKDLGELTPLQEQSVDIMLTCAEKLYNTIEDIILLARLDVEKEKYMLKEVDLTSLVKNTLNRVEKEIKEKKITLIQDIPNLSIIILGEQLMLIQTFLHILRNSIKFTPEQGTIRIILNQEEKNVVVRIRDTGIGLPENTVNEINEYLSSKNIYTNKKGNAITIGLNLLKRVIMIHNAAVQYKSEKGVGTEVIISFPLKS